MSQTIDISAVQLRRHGERLQVLVETDGVWRLVIDNPWPADGCGMISHIAEANGKFSWPMVEPDSPPPPGFTIPTPELLPQGSGNTNCIPCTSCGGMRMENCKDYPRHAHEWCDCQ